MKKLTVQILEECIEYFNIVVYLQKNSPFTESLNEMIRGLKSGGIIDKWTRDEIDKVSKLPDGNVEATTIRVLGLKDLQIAFVTLFVGLGLAAVSFVLEALMLRPNVTHL